MKFVKVDEVPMRRGSRKDLKARWDEFMSMNVKIVKVELNEHDYKNANVARSVLTRSVNTYGYPINVTLRDNEIYLVRRDM